MTKIQTSSLGTPKKFSTSELAKTIFSCPTAPFREAWVLKTIERILREAEIPSVFDVHGNLIANAVSIEELATARLAYFAHTDHPGFHLMAKAPTPKKSPKAHRYTGIWYGGGPFARMKNAKIRVFDPQNNISLQGRIVEIPSKGNFPTGRPLEVELREPLELSPLTFGTFDFPGFVLKNGRIITRAADDLAGCVAALGALMDLSVEKRKGVIAVFTRGEETGFIGCLAFLNSGWLSPDCLTVSLEASKTLPGAEIGKGPVLRIGDYATIFDNDLSQAFFAAAQAAVTANKKLKFQRRLMDGGTCEATALSVFGFRTTGLAVPLGNYHNEGPKGPAPEIISLSDLEGARKFLGVLAGAVDGIPQRREGLKNRLLNRYEPLAGNLHSWLSKDFVEAPRWAKI